MVGQTRTDSVSICPNTPLEHQKSRIDCNSVTMLLALPLEFSVKCCFWVCFMTNIKVQIGWGRTPRDIQVPKSSRIIEPRRTNEAVLSQGRLLDAIESPIGMPGLSELAQAAEKICILIPDESRKPIPDFILPMILSRLSGRNVSVGIASGKHPVVEAPSGQWRHDASSPSLVAAGTTSRGTVVEFPKRVLQADLRILIGEIRPHYFAGYAGGAKTLFPGVAGEKGIWHNHKLKASPFAALGKVDGNPCREDMENAARFAGPSFIVNIIRNHVGVPVDVVAGDIVDAHRAGVEIARPHFEVSLQSRSSVVLVSDKAPVTNNLYQACKLLPVAARLLLDGGTIILCAACEDGLGPIDIINEAIYRLGMVPILPSNHRVVLVSSQPAERVEQSFASYGSSVEAVLAEMEATDPLILPYAGELVPVLSESNATP